MLRCGLAAREAARKQFASVADFSLCPHQIRRSASLYHNKGNSSKGKSTTGRTRKTPSRLDLAEKETMREIRELKAQLATKEKVADAKAAHETMGELDEETLEMIYNAINAPDPSTSEELRLEARRRGKLSSPDDTNALLFETKRGQLIAQRLATLNMRMLQLQSSAGPSSDIERTSEDEKQKDPYERVSFLLGSIGVPKEVESMEEEEVASTSTSVRIANSTKGIALFTDASAREQLLNKVQQMANILDSGSQIGKGGVPALPLGIATKQEWEALAVCFAYAQDMTNVLKVLEAVEQSGHGSSLLPALNAAADAFALQGDVENCQALAVWMTEKGLSPDNYTHHCLVKAFLRSGQLDQALDLITQLEDVKPASLSTYTMILSHLLYRSDNSATRSRVWPLFNRMRLVAHPIPDAPCYTIMIQACALGVPQVNDALWMPGKSRALQKKSEEVSVPDTERGLDLFREMTIYYGIRPDVEAYSALIDCCAGRNDTYEKAWQLFRNMVDMERQRMDSESNEDTPSLAPSRKIFNSLLSGCRSNADLLRARWVLAEMLRSATICWQELLNQEERGEPIEPWQLRELEQRRPDHKTMTDIFLTYAKYVPPVSTVKIAASKEAIQGETEVVKEPRDVLEEGLSQSGQEETAQEMDEVTMTYDLPRTRRALLREANSLMERIKTDFQQQSGLLSSVKPSLALINSYLRVLGAHCPRHDVVAQLQQVVFGQGSKDDTRETNDKSLFNLFNLEVNGWALMTLLQMLGSRGRADGVLSFAMQVWEKWITLLGDGDLWMKDRAKATELGVTKNCISTSWTAMVRILANHGHLDEAMRLLRQFAELYPPPQPAEAAASQREEHTSMSSSLLSPLRGTDVARLERKAPQPPTLSFDKLTTLHMRLVESEKHPQDISYIKWLTMSYNPIKKMPNNTSPSFSMRQKQVRMLLAERERFKGALDHHSRS